MGEVDQFFFLFFFWGGGGGSWDPWGEASPAPPPPPETLTLYHLLLFTISFYFTDQKNVRIHVCKHLPPDPFQSEVGQVHHTQRGFGEDREGTLTHPLEESFGATCTGTCMH